jgi:hypothetical protein
MKLKLLVTMTLALMILGGIAQAFSGSGSVVVDIVGSKADNTRIESSDADRVVLEIVGSDTNNTLIAPPATKEGKCHKFIFPPPKCPKPKCPPKEDDTKHQCKSKCYPWENMHLGVDAWYDSFWYMNSPNMPKWPQI